MDTQVLDYDHIYDNAVFNLGDTQLLDYEFDGLGTSTQLEVHAIENQEGTTEPTQVASTQSGSVRAASPGEADEAFSPLLTQLEPGEAFQETQLEEHAHVEASLDSLPPESFGTQEDDRRVCSAGGSGNLEEAQVEQEEWRRGGEHETAPRPHDMRPSSGEKAAEAGCAPDVPARFHPSLEKQAPEPPTAGGDVMKTPATVSSDATTQEDNAEQETEAGDVSSKPSSPAQPESFSLAVWAGHDEGEAMGAGEGPREDVQSAPTADDSVTLDPFATGGPPISAVSLLSKDAQLPQAVPAPEACPAPDPDSTRLMDELLAEPEPSPRQCEDVRQGSSDPGQASDSATPGEETQREAFGAVERLLGILGSQASSQPSCSAGDAVHESVRGAQRGSGGPGSVAGGGGVDRETRGTEVSTGNAQERKQEGPGSHGSHDGAQSARSPMGGDIEGQGMNRPGGGSGDARPSTAGEDSAMASRLLGVQEEAPGEGQEEERKQEEQRKESGRSDNDQGWRSPRKEQAGKASKAESSPKPQKRMAFHPLRHRRYTSIRQASPNKLSSPLLATPAAMEAVAARNMWAASGGMGDDAFEWKDSQAELESISSHGTSGVPGAASPLGKGVRPLAGSGAGARGGTGAGAGAQASEAAVSSRTPKKSPRHPFPGKAQTNEALRNGPAARAPQGKPVSPERGERAGNALGTAPGRAGAEAGAVEPALGDDAVPGEGFLHLGSQVDLDSCAAMEDQVSTSPQPDNQNSDVREQDSRRTKGVPRSKEALETVPEHGTTRDAGSTKEKRGRGSLAKSVPGSGEEVGGKRVGKRGEAECWSPEDEGAGKDEGGRRRSGRARRRKRFWDEEEEEVEQEGEGGGERQRGRRKGEVGAERRREDDDEEEEKAEESTGEAEGPGGSIEPTAWSFRDDEEALLSPGATKPRGKGRRRAKVVLGTEEEDGEGIEGGHEEDVVLSPGATKPRDKARRRARFVRETEEDEEEEAGRAGREEAGERMGKREEEDGVLLSPGSKGLRGRRRVKAVNDLVKVWTSPGKESGEGTGEVKGDTREDDFDKGREGGARASAEDSTAAEDQSLPASHGHAGRAGGEPGETPGAPSTGAAATEGPDKDPGVGGRQQGAAGTVLPPVPARSTFSPFGENTQMAAEVLEFLAARHAMVLSHVPEHRPGGGRDTGKEGAGEGAESEGDAGGGWGRGVLGEGGVCVVRALSVSPLRLRRRSSIRMVDVGLGAGLLLDGQGQVVDEVGRVTEEEAVTKQWGVTEREGAVTEQEGVTEREGAGAKEGALASGGGTGVVTGDGARVGVVQGERAEAGTVTGEGAEVGIVTGGGTGLVTEHVTELVMAGTGLVTGASSSKEELGKVLEDRSGATGLEQRQQGARLELGSDLAEDESLRVHQGQQEPQQGAEHKGQKGAERGRARAGRGKVVGGTDGKRRPPEEVLEAGGGKKGAVGRKGKEERLRRGGAAGALRNAMERAVAREGTRSFSCSRAHRDSATGRTVSARTVQAGEGNSCDSSKRSRGSCEVSSQKRNGRDGGGKGTTAAAGSLAPSKRKLQDKGSGAPGPGSPRKRLRSQGHTEMRGAKRSASDRRGAPSVAATSGDGGKGAQGSIQKRLSSAWRSQLSDVRVMFSHQLPPSLVKKLSMVQYKDIKVHYSTEWYGTVQYSTLCISCALCAGWRP